MEDLGNYDEVINFLICERKNTCYQPREARRIQPILKEKRRIIRIACFVDTRVWIDYWKYPVSEAKDSIESGDDLYGLCPDYC